MGARRFQKGKEGGQILIIMALLSTTLIILFGMVVSIGHFVQAKVNLQNAVDLAAMTGASWQARYLNHISLVNYRMRQNYKFALYDLYVTQSRFNKGFRDTVARPYSPGMAPFQRVPRDRMVFGICQQMEGYMPQRAIGEDGEGTAGGTDMCQNVDDTRSYIPPIVPSPIVGTNPILIAANEAIRQLSLRAQKVCRDASGQNETYFEYLMKNLDNRQQFQMSQLGDVLNAFSQSFRTSGDQISGSDAGEATQAINRTFRTNLISANGSASLQFVNPRETLAVNNDFTALFRTMFTTRSFPSSEFTNYFTPLESFFRIKVVNIGVDGAGGCQFSVAEKQYPLGATGRIGVFLGLGRSRSASDAAGRPKVPFSVVLRAEVRPSLLFWPQGLTPTLVAVGAAKPFGSRVGPPKDQSDFEVSGGAGVRTSGGDNVFPLANMSFYPGDVELSDGTIPGVGHKKILGFLYSSLKNPTRGNNADRPSIMNTVNQCLGGDSSFICLALAPTLYEGLFWTVFPFPPSSNSATKLIPTSVVTSLFPQDYPVKTADDFYIMLDRMPFSAGGALNDLWHYTDDRLGDVREFQTQSGDPLFFANRKITLSSWSPTDTTYEMGRFGYQIKLASVREICEDIEAGGVVPLGAALEGYCRGGAGYNRVAH